MFLGTVVALVAGCYLLEGFIFSRRHAHEPPYIRSRIPLIGHFLDFMSKGTPYFSDLEYASARVPTLAVDPVGMRSTLISAKDQIPPFWHLLPAHLLVQIICCCGTTSVCSCPAQC